VPQPEGPSYPGSSGSYYPQGGYFNNGGYYWQHSSQSSNGSSSGNPSSESWRSAPASSQGFQGGAAYYAKLEEQANVQAQKMTIEYLKKAKLSSSLNNLNNNCENNNNNLPKAEENQEKVFIVYKFIQTPIEAIIAGM
jgi:hypothetical protein